MVIGQESLDHALADDQMSNEEFQSMNDLEDVAWLKMICCNGFKFPSID